MTNQFQNRPNSGPVAVRNKVSNADGTTNLDTPFIVHMMIQPFEDEQRVQEGITYGKSFYGFTDYGADIHESAQIQDWRGRTYTVRALERWDAIVANNRHLRLEIVSEAKGG